MQWRTEVEILPPYRKAGLQDSYFFLGSCFSDEMALRFSQKELPVLSNPFGTIFHPLALFDILEDIVSNKIYTEEDLLLYKGRLYSLKHSGKFSTDAENAKEFLSFLNQQISACRSFLAKANHIFITFGSAFYYEFIPQNKLVANCHKLPQVYFDKKLASSEAVFQKFQTLFPDLKKLLPFGTQIFFSVSPVRHTRDGMAENSHSKAICIEAAHRMRDVSTMCSYLPIFEIFLDDLRDYRFYKEDLIHPSSTGISYVEEKLKAALFSPELVEFSSKNEKIHKMISHIPLRPESEEYAKLQVKIKEEIKAQQALVPYPIFQEFHD